jgi:hypothetical protein
MIIMIFKMNVKWILSHLMNVMQKYHLTECLIIEIGQFNKKKLLLTTILKTLIEIIWLNTLVWDHHKLLMENG